MNIHQYLNTMFELFVVKSYQIISDQLSYLVVFVPMQQYPNWV